MLLHIRQFANNQTLEKKGIASQAKEAIHMGRRERKTNGQFFDGASSINVI